jgi:hypothetical protein
MSKPYPTDILKKLQASIVSWKEIDATLKFGDLSLGKMQAVLERGQALRNQIISLETQLTDLRNQRDEAYSTGWKYIIRLRNGIKGMYGDDSSEYEIVGMTPRSKHKPRSKRVK